VWTIFSCLVLCIVLVIALLTDKNSGALRQHPDQFWSETQVQGVNYSGKCKGQGQDWQPDNQKWNLSCWVPRYIISFYVWIALWQSSGRYCSPRCFYCLPRLRYAFWLVYFVKRHSLSCYLSGVFSYGLCWSM